MNQTPGPAPSALWRDPERGILARIASEIESRGLHAARTVVLVPYAQLMGVARAMWAQCARPGFVPRFESTRNWARSAGGFVPAEDDIAFDRGRDLLTAQSLLARAGLGGARAALAPRVVDIALQLAPLAAAQLPADRTAWSLRARELVATVQGSEWFGLEAAMHSIAVAWAANSAYETDVLLGGAAAAQADALIVLGGLQPDPLVERLAALFGARALHIDVAAVQAELAPADAGNFDLHEALDPEDEADRAAACVLGHVAAGRVPVALVATDRALTRRIGAQLAAHGVQPFDETGWKLSTTRAAATLMTALRACAHDASTDRVLDWLKGAPGFDAKAAQMLEQRLRDVGVRDWSTWRAIAAKAPPPERPARPGDEAVRAVTLSAEAQRASMAAARPLAQWLVATRALLEAADQWSALALDVAGARLIDALYLDAPPAGLPPQRWSLQDFVGWATDVLESVSAVLATLEQPDAAQVVVLPLQHVLGRSFGAVVIPGGDDQRLPASPEPPGDWTAAQRVALGLPSRDMLEAAQRTAWAIARQAPRCDVLRRRFDAQGEPVRASALVQLAQLDGLGRPAADPRLAVRLPVHAVAPPLPHGDALPVRTLSASAYEDLRRCPYRYFAMRQLGLRSADELDAQVDKRDFGTWLHAVLGHFHEALHDAPTTDAGARLALIGRAAERASSELGLSESEFLPFAAAWPAVRDGYLRWLVGHEAGEGARFAESEADRQQALGAITLRGRLDRIDRTADGRPFVIDYKTESLDTSKKRVAEPFEDTQLAFYAALLEDDALRAAYVNVGEKASGTNTVEQHDVVDVRDALIEGLMDDMQRIADGAALPALGEGAVCDFCAARGLCRKDFWAEGARPLVDESAPDFDDAAAPAPDVPLVSGSVSYVDAEAAYQHNGAHVARADFYAVACDPRRSVAVEACAGAGKTWMLVSRVLRALLEEGDTACQAHEILAITFTKKAAGEMRARLDEWLADFAEADLPRLESELRARGMSAVAAQAAAPRLKGLYRRLLEEGRPVQFRTFHAWFAGLLRSAPMAVLEQLGLPANYQLLEDDTQARKRVWRPFFAAVVNDPQAAEDYHALVATHGRSQTGKALEDALNRRVEFMLADRAGAVGGAVRAFGELYPAAAHVAHPSALLCGEAAHAQWLGWARALGAEGNKTPQKAATAIIDIFGTGPLADAREHWLVLRKAFFVAGEDRLTQHLAKYPAAQEAEAALQLLCAAQAQHDAWLYHQRLSRLTRLLIATFAQVKSAHGWIDMNDVEQSARLLLGNAQLWGWVQERLDAGVRHLMIDEFQDTNPLQWQALHGWLEGYAGAGGRVPSVFIVGDPKQSIYRFRRAEPQVFIAAKAFVRDGLQGEWLACDHTRRNARAVIGLVNGALQTAQAAGEFSDFRDHTTESADPGRVRKLPPIARGPKEAGRAAGAEAVWRDSLTTPRVLPEERLLQKECAQAARWVATRIASGVAPGQIMVLARKRDRLAVMQDELRKLHIAVQQPEKNDLHDMPEVQDIVALLDALVSTDHDLSLARALKSPLWRIDDEALAELAQRKRAQPARSWFELLQGDDLPAALEGIGTQLQRWKAWVDALPPHDALNAIYHEADVLARFAAAAPAPLRTRMQASLRGLLAASLELDGARFATPYALVRALRAGSAPAPSVAAAHAVQLLTVHGAKGLEAEVVLLLDTDTPPQRVQTMSALVKWPGQSPLPERFVFIASEKHPPKCAEADLAEEQAARHREEINGLYVATTRARNELAISSVAPVAGRGNPHSWWARLEGYCEVVDAAEMPFAIEALPGEEDAATCPALRMPPLPAGLAAAPARAVRTPDSRASAMGQAMHRLLEWAEPGAPLADAHVRAVAREFALDAGQARHAAALAERIRAGAGGWAWTLAELDWHGNEVTLVHEGRVLRIDRLVRHRASGVWWVLDYKSASRPERDPELLAQMRRYAAAVRQAHAGAPVKAVFLTGQGEMIEVT